MDDVTWTGGKLIVVDHASGKEIVLAAAKACKCGPARNMLQTARFCIDSGVTFATS
jgi:hypothetical protein